MYSVLTTSVALMRVGSRCKVRAGDGHESAIADFTASRTTSTCVQIQGCEKPGVGRLSGLSVQRKQEKSVALSIIQGDRLAVPCTCCSWQAGLRLYLHLHLRARVVEGTAT